MNRSPDDSQGRRKQSEFPREGPSVRSFFPRTVGIISTHEKNIYTAHDNFFFTSFRTLFAALRKAEEIKRDAKRYPKRDYGPREPPWRSRCRPSAMETLVSDRATERSRPLLSELTERVRCRALSTVMSADRWRRDFDVIGKLCCVALTEQLLKLFASPSTVNGTLLLIVLIFSLFSWKWNSPLTLVVSKANGRVRNDVRRVHFESQDATDSPPENELQKVGERVMSEHELRVQRSLQKLNVPDWYKSSTVPPQGFLLKRHSEGGGGGTPSGWQGLTSKTTSLSSLGSMHHATPRSPTSNLLSPSPTPSGHTFSRWSTSRLNSNPTSASTSPCGSARSSFNYRQPYLGWRSQERLSNPRTPAERLAAGLLSQTKQQPSVPNMNELSEVHSSIKEVTSAIVHYVSGSRADDRLSPAMGRHYDNSSSRSASPRGSNSRLCWLESSFVGNKPIDQPETPVSLTATPEHAKGSTDLYLDLTSTHRPNMAAVNDTI